MVENTPEYWKNRGNAALRSRDYRKGMECYKNAIDQNFRYSPAWHNLGLVLKKLGRTEESDFCFDVEREIEENIVYQHANNPYCEWCGQDLTPDHGDNCPVIFGDRTCKQRMKAREVLILSLYKEPGGAFVMDPASKQANQRIIFEVYKNWINICGQSLKRISNRKTSLIGGTIRKKKYRKLLELHNSLHLPLFRLKKDLLPGTLSAGKYQELLFLCYNSIFMEEKE